jgi:hypothetical protein
MDLLKRHHSEEKDRTRPPGGRPEVGPDEGAPVADANANPTAPAPEHGAPPPDPEHRYVGGAAPSEPPDDTDDPRHRTTARTPVTTVGEATDPRGQAAVAPPPERERRHWFGAGRHAHDHDADVDRDGVPDRHEADDRRPRREREVVDEVVIRRWSVADALITLVGAALAAVGVIGLIRAEVNETWYEPVVQVARADHTPLLAAIEVGAGVLIALAGIARRRIIATLLGVATAVAGAVAAMETAEVSRELAIEDWWGWVLCGAGVFVALMALVPRKGRIERVTRREAVDPDAEAAHGRGAGGARMA